MNDYAKHFRDRDARKAYDNRERYIAFGLLVGFIGGIALTMTFLGGTA